jgi:putative membrane protein
MLSSLLAFITYFGAAVLLLAAFLALYTWVTPMRDWEMIRAGNTAAAVALGGAVLGFCIPLAMAIARSHSLSDMVLWAATALLVQLASYAAVRFLRRHDHDGRSGGGVEAGDMAEATLLACAAVGLGLLNAACLT